MITETFTKEEKQLLTYYMDTEIFPIPRCGIPYHINKNMLELIVRPECNQKCEYCYVHQFGDKLYPKTNSKEQVLHNVELFLDYVYNNRRNYFYIVELFAGDLFYDGLFFDILEIIDKYFAQIKKDSPEVFDFRTNIITPSNLSFVNLQPEMVDRFRSWHCYFLEEYNTKLAFSWSSDGAPAVANREKRELDEEWFDNIFRFCKEFDCGCHPMIAACNKDVFIETYDWWTKKLEQFELNQHSFMPAMLEVRNYDWTDESIDKYLELLDHMMEDRFHRCNNDTEELTKHFFGYDDMPSILKRPNNYDPLIVENRSFMDSRQEGVCCAMQHAVHLNCNTLSLSICHRLSYPEFTPCYFIEEDGHIVDYDVHNITSFITLRCIDSYDAPMCNDCDIKGGCICGCYGSQYEYSGEIMLPIPSVCNLMKRKHSHLVKLYNDYGLVKKAIELNLLRNDKKENWIKWSEKEGYLYD